MDLHGRGEHSAARFAQSIRRTELVSIILAEACVLAIGLMMSRHFGGSRLLHANTIDPARYGQDCHMKAVFNYHVFDLHFIAWLLGQSRSEGE